MVTIREKVTKQIIEGAADHADRLAKKYLGLDKHLTTHQTRRNSFKDKSRKNILPAASKINQERVLKRVMQHRNGNTNSAYLKNLYWKV